MLLHLLVVVICIQCCTIFYFRNMPEIDVLMQEWPPEFEELLKEVSRFFITGKLKLACFYCYVAAFADVS